MATQSESQQDYKDELTIKLEEFNTKINEFKVRASQSASESPMESHSKMQELYIKRDLVEAKLEELQNASKEEWANVKVEFERAWDDLCKTFETTLEKFN
jgi:sugar phosphate isomerase/epimerase